MKIGQLLLLLIPLCGGTAIACDEYEAFSIEEIKEFRDVLQQENSDPLDKLFAFEQMACSDRSTVRHFAVKEGLKNIKDPLVRNEIMLRAMMQKPTISIVLSELKDLTGSDKAFIKKHAGVYSVDVAGRSVTQGCIGLYYKDCDVRYSVFIQGDKVQVNYHPVKGEFILAETNELVGTLRGGKDDAHTPIPAVIKLF